MKSNFAVFLLGSMLLLSSCGASRKTAPTATKSPDKERVEKTVISTDMEPETAPVNAKAIAISEHAKNFLGTKYKYGGTSKKGMDCSGLIYTAFLEEDIALPRISREMSLLGTRLYLKEVTIGDLLFFETNKNRKVINHVGLVVETQEEEIFFIHSSTSQGVIISSLKNPYWEEHFVMARRVL